MESHRTRHYVGESLRERHPYLEPPIRKTVDLSEIADSFGARKIPKARLCFRRASACALPPSQL